MIDKCLLTIYKNSLLYMGRISQEKEVITLKIPQHLQIEYNSFYMIIRIHILDGKLVAKSYE